MSTGTSIDVVAADEGVSAGRRVRVADVIDETADARSIVIEPEPQIADAFAYRPGQFLTVRVPDVGRGVARCYSLASSPHTDTALKITVKRVLDGHGSNWLCDNVSVGDSLEVLPPAGTFTPRSLDESTVLVAGGSGITPIISIAKSILFGGSGDVVLIYANRDQDSVIFGPELRSLTNRFGDRLTIFHVLESVQGYPSEQMLGVLLRPLVGREVYVCGPAPLMDMAVSVCDSVGFASKSVHVERFRSLQNNPFGSAPPPPGPADADDVACTVSVTTIDGDAREVAWQSQQKLLDALIAAGVDAPFSCREGACSACVCTLTSGEVTMANNEVLTDDDIDDGYILACQAEPVTDHIAIEY